MPSKKIPFSTLDITNLLDTTELPSHIYLLHKLTEDKIEELLQQWGEQTYVALDLETSGLVDRKEALNPFALRIRLIQVGFKGQVIILDTFKASDSLKRAFFKRLKTDLINPKKYQILHNAAFDLSILRVKSGIRAVGIRDTMIIGRMLNAGLGSLRPSSLEALSKQFLGIKADKSHQKDDWSVEHLSNSQYLYAANDVILTEKLFYAMVKESRCIPNIDLSGRPTQFSFIENIVTECEAVPAFVEIFATGQPVDLDYIEDVIKQYEFALEDLYKPVFIKLGLPQSAQPQKLHKAIKEVYGVTLKSVGGEDKTSADALFLTYLESGEEDLLRLALTRSLAKLVDTLKKMRDSAQAYSGYARGRYTSLGQKASGRSTCGSGGKDSSLIALNLQNIPNDIIHPLVAKYNLPKIRSVITHGSKLPDKSMALFDLSASHARYAASSYLSGDSSLLEVMELEDPHSYLTLKLARLVGYDWDMDYYNSNKKKDAKVAEIRSVAKTALYTQFNGGSGIVFYNSLLKAFQNVSFDLCNKAKTALEEAFPKYSSWVNNSKWKLASTKDTFTVKGQEFARWQTPSGRVYHCEVMTKVSQYGKEYKTVKAGEISSACLISVEAYAMKQALVECYNYIIENPDNNYQINSFTHDDLSITDPTADKLFAQYVYGRIAYWFTKTLGDDVPSTMSPDDGKWEKGLINNYSEK